LDDAVRHFGADAPSRESDADADAARVLRDLAVAEPAAAPVAQPVAEPISSLHVARAGAEPRASIDRVGTSGDPYRGGRVASERMFIRIAMARGATEKRARAAWRASNAYRDTYLNTKATKKATKAAAPKSAATRRRHSRATTQTLAPKSALVSPSSPSEESLPEDPRWEAREEEFPPWPTMWQPDGEDFIHRPPTYDIHSQVHRVLSKFSVTPSGTCVDLISWVLRASANSLWWNRAMLRSDIDRRLAPFGSDSVCGLALSEVASCVDVIDCHQKRLFLARGSIVPWAERHAVRPSWAPQSVESSAAWAPLVDPAPRGYMRPW